MAGLGGAVLVNEYQVSRVTCQVWVIHLIRSQEKERLTNPFSLTSCSQATMLCFTGKKVDNTALKLKKIEITEDTITTYLIDGRTITVPLVWSWRLSEATPEQRANYEIIGDGEGVHWPDIDEDISVEGMLYGTPAPRPKRDAAKPIR